MRLTSVGFLFLSAMLMGTHVGCLPTMSTNTASRASNTKASVERGPARVRPVNLNVPEQPVSQERELRIAGAKNETLSFAVQVDKLPQSTARRAFTLRVNELKLKNGQPAIAAQNLSAYQILPMPIDVNRAGFVRHTGLAGNRTMIPRALLPVPINGGAINLAALRKPSEAANPQSRGEGTGEPLLIWFDIHVPPETPPGDYLSSVDIVETGASAPMSSTSLRIAVYDFVLPDERHLMMAGTVDWRDLERLFPDRFESVRPTRVSRIDSAYAKPLATLDRLVDLAQRNRVLVNFSRLQPIVKWPAGKPPEVAWKDYDELVAPWLKGEIFPDKVGMNFWPLPTPDYLSTYDATSRGEYLAQAAGHFDQLDWMNRSAARVGENVAGRASTDQSLRFSADAQRLLELHPQIRVMLPLQEDQLQLADKDRPMMVAKENVSRLIAAAPPLVFASPLQRLPDDVKRPARFLRADFSDAAAAGLTPYVGAGGDEYDVRLWAWLAFLRSATLIEWNGVLPRADSPQRPADPNELIWFYPGSWFGVDDPVPTIQLKWLRNAQQDYEYLWLARQRGQTINAYLMARLITKPVEIQPNQNQDPTYALMCGTANPSAWQEAKQLLVDNILLRDPGTQLDENQSKALNMRMLRWSVPQERPILMGRTTTWTYETLKGLGESFINLRLGIDIYNASDSRPDRNELQWTSTYAGSEISPKPISISSLATYNVRRVTVEAKIDPTAAPATKQTPVTLSFTNGFTSQKTELKLNIPAAVTDRRDKPIDINGDLDDWTAEDAIVDGPLVQMFNRPALQAGVLQSADTSSLVCTGWADERFYVGFKVAGLPAEPDKTIRNFVSYQYRRAWGEDLCQLLIQPVYGDNSLGPVLHVVCKANGSVWVERKLDARLAVEPWQAFEGAGIRYQARIDAGTWRGEVAIPWQAILDADHQRGADGRPARPTLLRFNFAQHKSATGESASWAGPIDFGRDDAFTGVLLLRDVTTPGMR